MTHISLPQTLFIRGGERLSLSLAAGESCVITDEQGAQPCILEVAGQGRSIFPENAPPGTCFTFAPAAACDIAISAPGAAMEPHEQTPPTDLRVTIHRASATLPAPLANVKNEFLVKASTAQSYHVAAGDYIQIIDVSGQQCSDFLAFDAAKLAAGEEHGLDPTTTRTLGGQIYPVPGLYAKFFDDRMIPLVEVIRDTCGRHDTFGLACSAKGYADAGYPGHDNCTDNFNAVLATHKVKPRAGWPAINFFYNTAATATGAIVPGEAWSRPGDYVLLRALDNLVCATSSCADDIGVTNGYNPTDILVRIYESSANFSKGIAHRMTPDAEPRLTRETGCHVATAARTRDFAEIGGFWLPNSYPATGIVAEYWAARQEAALFDLSSLRKFEITGPDAENLLSLALTRNVRKLSVGQVVYTAMCYKHGGMIDDGTVLRLGPNNFRFVCGTDFSGVWLRELAEKHSLRAFVRSSTDQLHNLSLQGPKSRDLLAPLIFTPPLQPSLAELKWFRFTIARLHGPNGIPLVVSRTGYTGELGYEVWFHPSNGMAIFEALVEAGAIPAGFAALDMLRIEAGLILAGHEFSDETDPYEAGIGFAVADSEERNFVGRDALRRRAASPHRKLVGLDIDGAEMVNHGDCIHVGRAQIGVITSAIRSPVLQKSIALARIDAHHAVPGAKLEIGKLDGFQKRLPATVTAFPHYDPTKSRVRA